MTGDVETAETSGRSTGFPASWGRPAGTQWSEERADWVRDRCARFAGLQALEQLANRDRRYLLMLQRAVLMSRRNSP